MFIDLLGLNVWSHDIYTRKNPALVHENQALSLKPGFYTS